jgi:hypothetical protein
MLMDVTVLRYVFVVSKVLGEGGESEGNANILAGLESSLNLSELMEF